MTTIMITIIVVICSMGSGPRAGFYDHMYCYIIYQKLPGNTIHLKVYVNIKYRYTYNNLLYVYLYLILILLIRHARLLITACEPRAGVVTKQ